MKIRGILLYIILCLAILIFSASYIFRFDYNSKTDEQSTQINRLSACITKNWDELDHGDDNAYDELKKEKVSFDYTILDTRGTVILMTKKGLSENVYQAAAVYDIIWDLEVDGEVVGKLLVHNPQEDINKTRNKNMAFVYIGVSLVSLVFLVGYSLYFYLRYIRPFKRMKSFAIQIAMGNLDVPLDMDKGHIFGEFTESFDIMRNELKLARVREEDAVRSRKELIAELSHDIKTPVASIKAMADVLELSVSDEIDKKTVASINAKADQIDSLVSNLFHATLEELEHLEVKEEEFSSKELVQIIHDADYLNYIESVQIDEALLLGDVLRFGQVIGNIITNSYKYASTAIEIKSYFENRFLVLQICDQGMGVPEEELDLIMQKFTRGSNVSNQSGAGLGLYISKHLMEKMGGSLYVKNGGSGFTVVISIRLA